MDWLELVRTLIPYTLPAVLAWLGWTNRAEIKSAASAVSGKLSSAPRTLADRRRALVNSVFDLQACAVECGAPSDKIDKMTLTEIADWATNYQPEPQDESVE